MTQKVTLFLWFDGKAERAARFYASIFKKSKILSSDAMSTTFLLDGREYIAFNGGPEFRFTPAMSLFVSCRNQKEVDYYWKKLSAGGKPGRCGWLTDKFGVSWQIVPEVLGDLLGHKDREKADRALQAMLKMGKLEIAGLKKAFNGK